MNEAQQAIALANRVLNKPYIDPDGDIYLLARQFLRSLEREKALAAAIEECLAIFGARLPYDVEQALAAINPRKVKS